MLLLLLGCSSDESSSISLEEIITPGDDSSSEQNSDSVSQGSVADFPYIGAYPVIFSEVDPINISYRDHEGDDPAWVELYNTADTAVNLAGLYLTDKLSKPTKWQLGDVVVAPHEHAIVFLSGKDLKNFEPPHDSLNMIGSGIWSWDDRDAKPIAGLSFVEPFAFTKYYQKGTDGVNDVSAQMQYGENEELGWHSASLFVGTTFGSKNNTVDIRKANELLLTGFLTKGAILEIRLTQPDIDDWKGYATELVGTGDSTTTYSIALPANANFPDLANIYGTRFAPGSNEMSLVQFKFTDYIARNRGHEPHASFKIKNEGGHLYLTNGDGTNGTGILDSVAYPVMPAGKTWNFDGSVWGYADASPANVPSSAVYTSQAQTVEMPSSGFYSDAFYVSFSPSMDGSETRCEIGGALPTENSAAVFEPLLISKTTVLRCAAFKAGALPSEVVSRTYVFETKPALATIFLTGDPRAWFDPDTGIYMEGPNAQSKEPHYGANYWLDKELPIHIDFFEPGSATPNFSEEAGYEIFGNYSRQNAKKSAAIVFREKYGKKYLDYSVFPEYPELTKFKWIVLRNNGSNFGNEYLRDRFASSMSKGLGVDYQKARPSIVYYNGKYYGIHNIRERSNKYYFETNYGLDPETIDLLDAGNTASAGSAVDYMELIDYLDVSSAASQVTYDYVKSKMDVENFMNYMATEMFANNRDWPSNNLKKWRCNAPATRWKWFFYDMDFGMGNNYSEYKNNIFEFATTENGESWPNGPESTFLLRSLLKNEEFKAAFINRFALLVATKFSSDTLTAKLNAMYAEIRPEIERDQKRWKLNASYMTKQENETYSFIQNRQRIILNEMQEFFGLGALMPVKISVVGDGNVFVHGLVVPKGTHTVQFFAGFPVVVSASSSGAGVFNGWSDGETSAVRVIDPALVSELTAVFK